MVKAIWEPNKEASLIDNKRLPSKITKDLNKTNWYGLLQVKTVCWLYQDNFHTELKWLIGGLIFQVSYNLSNRRIPIKWVISRRKWENIEIIDDLKLNWSVSDRNVTAPYQCKEKSYFSVNYSEVGYEFALPMVLNKAFFFPQRSNCQVWQYL